MDDFCNSTFWDLSLTWNTDKPDFTVCFEQTVLIWIPALLILLISLLEIPTLLKSTSGRVPWSVLMVIKIVGVWSLIVLHTVHLSLTYNLENDNFQFYDAERFSSLVKIGTYMLVFFVMVLHKSRGISSSGMLLMFWLISFCCGVFAFQTNIRTPPPDGDEKALLHYQNSLIDYPIVVVMFFLNCLADKSPLKSIAEKITEVNPCPESDASVLSKIVYFWFEGLARLGLKKYLESEDLWDLQEDNKSKNQVPYFLKNWDGPSLQADVERRLTKTGDKMDGSVLKTLLKTFGTAFLFGALLKFVQDLLNFVSPQMIKLLISFVRDPEDYYWKGFLYIIILFGTSMIQTVLMGQYSHQMFVIGMRIRTTVTAAIYRKSLRLSNANRTDSASEIINFVSKDSQRLMDTVMYLNMLWSAPLQIALSIYFIWDLLGPSVFAGVGLMILLIPVNGLIVGINEKLKTQQTKRKNNRVKFMTEILSGIQALKLYCWESYFEKHVMDIRRKEINGLRNEAYFQGGTSFFWACTPYMVSLVTFATYVLSDEQNVLDAEKAFVTLTLFNIMIMPLMLFPINLGAILKASSSLKRLSEFLNAEQFDEDVILEDNGEEDPVVIENGEFSWKSNTIALKNVNLRVQDGSLVAVVGAVRCGKSSLLSAILGEMNTISGSVKRRSNVAYVAQETWIENCSVKDNVLFGEDLDQQKYIKVINACDLKRDLETFPMGDRTEIGDRGFNLTEDQKQRISLARAAYSNSDIYLLDDPISALDFDAGKLIFENMFGPHGILKEKTRLLVTQSSSYLPHVDHIVFMKDGEIIEQGGYDELMRNKGHFTEFILSQITSEMEPVYKSVLEKLNELEEALDSNGNEFERLQLHSQRADSISVLSSRKISAHSNGTATKTFNIPTLKRGSLLKENSSKLDEKLLEASKTSSSITDNNNLYLNYLKSIGLQTIFLTLFFNAVYQGCQLGASEWLCEWSKEKLNADGTIDTDRRNMFLGVYALFGLCQVISFIIATILITLGILKAAFLLHNKMLSNVLRSPMSFFDTTPIKNILNRFSKDVYMAENALPLNLRSWFQCLFSIIATVTIISVCTPWFLVPSLPLAIVFCIAIWFYIPTSRQLKELECTSKSRIYTHFGEMLKGSTTIRAYSMQERFILESESKVDYSQKCFYPTMIADRWLEFRVETIGSFGLFFAGLFVVLGRESLSPEYVGLSLSYAFQIRQTLRYLARMTFEVATSVEAVKSIKEYGETLGESDAEISEEKLNSARPSNGLVTFDRYQCRYREGLDLVLRNVTFTVEPNEKVGIVGRPGSGKSALTLALLRILDPCGGHLSIDSINIANLGLYDLRSRITVIPQRPVLFSGSIRMNLDPKSMYSDDEIWRTLELAHLKTFVKDLPSGLSHELIEGGCCLSVRQRHLISLARALLRKTKVIVFEEATEIVDLDTNELILDIIHKEFKDSTILIIAYRLNTVMNLARVLVMDKGEITEDDSPSNLLGNKKSLFYGMANEVGIV